jgi:hypothetical protein
MYYTHSTGAEEVPGMKGVANERKISPRTWETKNA